MRQGRVHLHRGGRTVLRSFLFDIFQMVQWLVWDPWWSLAVAAPPWATPPTGRAYAHVLAGEPHRVRPFTLRGAFLRQAEVSVEFAEMLRDRVLTAELWARSSPPSEPRASSRNSRAQDARTDSKSTREGGMVALAAGVLGEKAWRAAEDAAAARSSPNCRRTSRSCTRTATRRWIWRIRSGKRCRG